MQEAGTRGIEAAWEASKHLDQDNRPRSARLIELIAYVGQQRRMPAEVLRLYDPVAYRLFYSAEADRRQCELFEQLLDWEQWTESVPHAAVRAAPAAALKWLRTQAAAESPRRDEVARMLDAWSRWIESRNERLPMRNLRALAVELGQSGKFVAGDSHGALLSYIGHVRAARAIGIVTLALKSGDLAARAQAYAALGLLGSEDALIQIAEHALAEKDREIQVEICMALQRFRSSRAAGAVALSMIKNTDRDEIRREVLLSLQDADWPQRSEIVMVGLQKRGEGVLGAALDAVRAGASAEVRESVMAVSAGVDEPWPQVVDALGEIGDARAVPKLNAWLARTENEAIRTKLVLALEKIGGKAAGEVIRALVESESNAGVMQHVLRAAGRLQVSGALASVIELALDHTAPPDVRAEAIWTLGHFPDPQARQCLARLSRDPALLFDTAGGDADPEEIGQARRYVELARLKLGEEAAVSAIEDLYRSGTPADQLIVLVALGYLNVDHPLIVEALKSADFPVVLGAAKAAHDIGPQRYRDVLASVRREPFMQALLETGLQDVATLRHYLDNAVDGRQGR